MPLGHTMVLRFILARLHPRLGTVRTCLKRIAPTCGGDDEDEDDAASAARSRAPGAGAEGRLREVAPACCTA